MARASNELSEQAWLMVGIALGVHWLKEAALAYKNAVHRFMVDNGGLDQEIKDLDDMRKDPRLAPEAIGLLLLPIVSLIEIVAKWVRRRNADNLLPRTYTVDVQEPRTGVPRIDLPGAAADAVFADAKAFLSSGEARQMSESELERELHRRGQELVRKLLQEHHDQRSPGETAGPAEGASGVECSEPSAGRPSRPSRSPA